MIEGLDRFKEVLEEEGDYLLEKLTLNPVFFASLVAKKICTDSELDDIESIKKRSNQVWEVVKLLKKRGRREFEAFLDVLRNTGQSFISTKLVADLKHKKRNELSESKVSDNISGFVHSRLILKKLLPMAELRHLEEHLVVKADYTHQVQVAKQLQLEVHEMEMKLKEEQQEHQDTREDVKNITGISNTNLKENQQLQADIEQFKEELKGARKQVSQLQGRNKELKEQLAEVVERLEEAVSLDVPDGPEESPEDGRGSKQDMIDAMEEELRTMDERLKSQECDIVAMNKKIMAVLGKDVKSHDSFNKMEVLVKNLDDLVHDYMDRGSEVADEGNDEEETPPERRKSKRKTSVHRAKMLSTVKEMKRKMAQMNNQWEEERYEMQLRVKSMQKSLKSKIWEVRKLEDQLAVFSSSSSSPSRKQSQDTTASGFTGISIPVPVKSMFYEDALTLPQVMDNSSMVCADQGVNQGGLKRVSSYPQSLRREKMQMNKSYPGPPGYDREVVVDLQSLGSKGLRLGGTPIRPQKTTIEAPVKSCTQCKELVSEEEVKNSKCRFHKGNFHTMTQMWTCCRWPKAHPGCVVDAHKVRRLPQRSSGIPKRLLSSPAPAQYIRDNSFIRDPYDPYDSTDNEKYLPDDPYQF